MASNLASSETEHQYSSPASPKDDFIQLFLKYPSAADKYVEEYLRDHEFGENVAEFNKLSGKTAVVTVKPASVGNTLVSNLNGAKIQGQYNLQAVYYKKRSVIKEKQSKGSTENATSMGNDCELYVGASLPSSTTKKDIYEHFDKFASDIQNVELAEDEFTHLFKGHVFIKFSTPEAASRAMQTLHHTMLLGICINIRHSTRKTSKVISKFSPPSHGAKLCHGTVRGEHKQSQSSLATSTAVSQNGGSIKVTKLPQGITMEELRLHFLSVGVIKGEPTIKQGKPCYAFINYVAASSAERAASILNGTSIKGTSITVKVQGCRNTKLEIMLNSSQWNSLMHIDPLTGTSFNKLVEPFLNNPDVQINPDIQSQCIKLTGKQGDVTAAHDHLIKHLYGMIYVERCKMEALCHLKPNLPDDIGRHYNIDMSDFRPDASCIKLDGLDIEEVHKRVTEIIDSIHTQQVHLQSNLNLKQLKEEILTKYRSSVYITFPQDHAAIISIWSLDRDVIEQVLRDIPLVPHDEILTCSPEEEVYLKYLMKDTVSSSLSAKIKFNSGKVVFTGMQKEIHQSKNYIQTIVFSGLQRKKYHFSCHPAFQSLIKAFVLIPQDPPDDSLQYHIQPSKQSKGDEKGFDIYIFSTNPDFFNKICKNLESLQPDSKIYKTENRHAKQIVLGMKEEMEEKHGVKLIEIGVAGFRISGLRPHTVQDSIKEIDCKIKEMVIVEKYIPISDLHYELLKNKDFYLNKMNELKKIYEVMDKKGHDSCVIKFRGKSCEVAFAKEKLESEVINTTFHKEELKLECPRKQQKMWLKRWSILKQQEEANFNTFIFITSKINDKGMCHLCFKIIGSDEENNKKIQEVIIAEGTAIEKRAIVLSKTSTQSLYKTVVIEKRYNELSDDYCIHYIDRDANTVTITVPKVFGDAIDMAEEHLRKFVGEKCSYSYKIIDFEYDSSFSLLLASPTRYKVLRDQLMPMLTEYKVELCVQKYPKVSLRLNGVEVAVNYIRPQIASAIQEFIKCKIKRQLVPVDHLQVPYLTTPEFLRFKRRLEVDFCVTTSYPKESKANKVVCSSNIDSESSNKSIEVQICTGNIVVEQVDAIVNAASNNLKHSGGLAKAISEVGGSAIQEESDEFIKTHNVLKTGRAVCLGPGNLSCKKVIHAVGPRWREESKEKGEQLLHSAVLECLKVASVESLKSLAFPAIGTGIFKVPEDVCARISLKAVKDFVQSEPNSSIEIVKFVIFEKHTNILEAFISAFAEYQEKNTSPTSVVKEKNGSTGASSIHADVIITLRGPDDCLDKAKESLQKKLKDCLTEICCEKLPKVIDTPFEEKLCQISRKHTVSPSFDNIETSDGKIKRVLNLKGVSCKCKAALEEIEDEILTFLMSTDEDISFPSEWQSQSRTTEVFSLPQGSTERALVHTKFSVTMSGHQIIDVQRIQNKWLWEKYSMEKSRLKRKNDGIINEKELFHGTRSNDPRNIYEGEEGFDMRFSRQGMWGMANYFAVNASYSHGYSFPSASGQQMFLVKVLTGDSHQCASNPSLRMPPEKPSGSNGSKIQFSQIRYDTVTGETNGSQVFMAYKNDRAYPTYLITYK